MIRRIKRSVRNRLLRLLSHPSQVELQPVSSSELAEIRVHYSLPKFFIMGYPRSGTTLLARLLRQSPEISCRWQGHFASGEGDWIDRFGQPALAEWLAQRSNRWSDNNGPSLASIARASSDFVMERVAHAEGSRIVGDKTPTPRMDQAIERLHRLYPDAFLIAIVRDGRDAALSQRVQAFIDQPETLSPLDARMRKGIEDNPKQFGVDGKSIFSPAWLRRVARHWNASVGQGHQLGLELYGDHYHYLRYEDLLSDPIAEMERVFDFLGARFSHSLEELIEDTMQQNPAADWHQQAAPALATHLRRGTAGSWRDWFTPADQELFHAVAEDQLVAWNYPLS